MLHMNKVCHIWMSHIIHFACIFGIFCAVSKLHTNKSCRICPSHVTREYNKSSHTTCLYFGKSHVIGSFIWGVSNVFWAISCDWLIYMGFGKCVLGNLMCLTPVYGGLQMYFGQSRVFDLFLWGFANVFWAISCCCRTPYKWVMSSVNKSISHVMNKSCHIQMSNVAHLVCT